RSEVAMDGSATTVERANAAATGADWDAAVELFSTADAQGELGPADIADYAEAAYAAGHLEQCVALWERAHTDLLSAGMPIEAAGAAVQVAMHLLMDTALMAPVRGWLS